MDFASSRVGYSLSTLPSPCHGISRTENMLSVLVISCMVMPFGWVLLCADIRNTTPSVREGNTKQVTVMLRRSGPASCETGRPSRPADPAVRDQERDALDAHDGEAVLPWGVHAAEARGLARGVGPPGSEERR